MDAEIQKKVAEFKEKIAKAQLEKQQQQLDIGPPAIALPTALGGTVPPAGVPAQPPPPTLPKDFQDALDIIFPSEVKPDMSQQDLFSQMPFMGLGGVMPPFPPFLQPQMPPGMMMGFDMNGPLGFPPRPQLYDTHENGEAAAAQAKKEELDDLAMLGIDASDVGAGI
ncbi:hypothetical protein NE865_06648 [Phthorimaea operculella]|nr:hypothetical protein NE865_06648 [Phthorimaea operculella]